MDAQRQRLETLIRSCGRRAWTVAWSLLRDGHEAQDAVQQALLVAARKHTRIPTDDPWPWFSVVVAHEARNLRRKRRPLPTGSPTETDAVRSTHQPSDADPSRLSAQREDASRVQRALDQLPPEERDAVALVHLSGMSQTTAAEALGVPRQTLTSRLGRAMRSLEQTLAQPHGSIASSLAVLPIAAPPTGWEGALATWTQTTLASVAGSTAAATTTLGGLTLMSSKTWLALSLTAALGVGFFGGHLAHTTFLDGESGPSDAPHGLAPQAADASDPGSSSDTAATPTLDSRANDPIAVQLRLSEENADLRRRLADSEAKRAELSKLLGSAAPRGPTFTFGKVGALAAIREANWSEMAEATSVVHDSIHTILTKAEAGESVPKEIYLALQENVERMRKYEYRTIGKMPTAAKHNGEFTHPITVANLFATMLADAGKPLSDTQVKRIEELGLRFEREFAAQRERHGDDTPRVMRILEEYRLKGSFTQDLAGVLDAEQKAIVYNEDTRGIASLDLHDPTLMIIHTSPILTGASADEIALKLTGLLTKKLGLDETGVAALERPLDQWKHDVRGLLGAVTPTRVKHYTYDQGDAAGAATVRLVNRILGELDLTPEAREALLDDHAIYVPRIVSKPS